MPKRRILCILSTRRRSGSRQNPENDGPENGAPKRVNENLQFLWRYVHDSEQRHATRESSSFRNATIITLFDKARRGGREWCSTVNKYGDSLTKANICYGKVRASEHSGRKELGCGVKAGLCSKAGCDCETQATDCIHSIGAKRDFTTNGAVVLSSIKASHSTNAPNQDIFINPTLPLDGKAFHLAVSVSAHFIAVLPSAAVERVGVESDVRNIFGDPETQNSRSILTSLVFHEG